MSLGGLGGAGLDSPLGQAFRLIETMYWQAEVWFMVAMLLIALVVILLVVTGWLGFSLQRIQGAFRKLSRGDYNQHSEPPHNNEENPTKNTTTLWSTLRRGTQDSAI